MRVCLFCLNYFTEDEIKNYTYSLHIQIDSYIEKKKRIKLKEPRYQSINTFVCDLCMLKYFAYWSGTVKVDKNNKEYSIAKEVDGD